MHTLFRSKQGRFVKIAAKTVRVRYLRDPDGDGERDGSYRASFSRPRAAGTYRVVVRFKGARAPSEPCSRAREFTLAAT